MIVKGIIDEDFVNYRVPSMTIMFPNCTFKCGKEYCQNSMVAESEDIEIPVESLCKRYMDNPITSAVVLQGLEPMDDYEYVLEIVMILRGMGCHDDIVIYTGYNKSEIADKISELATYENIVIKYGRFIPDHVAHFDPVLGVELASSNQYAERIS